MTVSVIIPVYNVKPYLERCVNSVLDQTYKDLEIILVDDGSTDGSGELCDQIAGQDNRINVVHQDNQGLSGARNAGIYLAKGEYIIFLDSDDSWLLNEGLEMLLKNVEDTTPDLIIFKNIDIWQDGHSTVVDDYDLSKIAQFADGSSVFRYLVTTQQFSMSACFLIVRRNLLTDNSILFPIGLISEDVFWSMHLWQYVNTVRLTNINLYGYYHREASITTTGSIRTYHSYDQIFSYWKKQCDEGCKNADAIRAYLANMWVNRGYGLINIKANERPEAISILKKHTDILDYGVSPKSRRVRWMLKLFGINFTAKTLGWYWCLRKFIR